MSSEKGIPQYDGPGAYRGPSMDYLIQNHQLAAKIVETHADHPANILDAANLAVLRDYVRDPGNKVAILRAHGIDVEAEEREGNYHLAAYCVVHDVFDEDEVKMLREWFENPQVEADLKDPKYAEA
jgi:hypothetical protein